MDEVPGAVGSLVTGTLVSIDTWEYLHLRQLGDHDDTLRRAVRYAIGHLDDAAEKGLSGLEGCVSAGRA